MSPGLETTITSHFQSLPLDLLIDSILVLLPVQDLLSLSCTCRSLYSTIHDTELIWKRKVATDYRFPSDATGRVTGFKTLYRKLRKPQVWVWGQDRSNRLGLGSEQRESLLEHVLQGFEDVPTPLRLQTAESIGIIDLQAGGWSFHGLDVDGGVWCWGTLDGLSAGWNQEPHRLCHAKKSEPEPAMLPVKNFPKVKAISCGRSHAMAISDQGNIYEWHSWSRVAQLCSVPWNEKPQHYENSVVQISASWDFSALLSHDGSIYFWREPSIQEVKDALDSQFDGLSDESRAGIVYKLDSGDRIIRCPDLPGSETSEQQDKNHPIKIATGEDFIICLTASGKVYKLDVSKLAPEDQATSFGPISVEARLHQDALSSRENLRTAFLQHQRSWEYLSMFSDPAILKTMLIKALPGERFEDSLEPKITHISAQYRTFVAYSVETPSESQQSTKKNSFVFFGKKETSKDDEPDILPDLQRRGVIQVTLGDYHYVALLSNGQVLTWGQYSAGALGIGHSANPHRQLGAIGSEYLDNKDQGQFNPESGTQKPVVIHSFSGTDHRLIEREPIDQSNRRVPPRYVFSVTAAGWHTGCLAFTLDEEEDDDYGLGVLENPTGANNERGQNDMLDDLDGLESSVHPMPTIIRGGGPRRVRIGYAGRFMRGGVRGVPRDDL